MSKIKNIAQLKAKFAASKITKEGLRRMIQSGVIGRVKGIIGPYVLRYEGDNLIISKRPLIYHASRSRASVLGRKNFTSEIRFAREVNNTNILKELWKHSPVKGISAYHKMIFCNKMKKGLPSPENIITPPDNQLHYDNLCSLNGNYSIEISENAHFENNDRLIIFLVPYDPVHKSSPSFETIKLEITSPVPGIIDLDETKIAILKNYKKYLLYSAVVRQEENSIFWSNTLCVKGRIIDEEKMAFIYLLVATYRIQNVQRKRLPHLLRNIRYG